MTDPADEARIGRLAPWARRLDPFAAFDALDVVQRFAYLKNGAMYSIGVLGGIMCLESFGTHFPFWFAPLNTFALLIVFLALSIWELRLDKKL